MQSEDLSFVASGGAGTGKSLTCLTKLHRRAVEFPQSRWLVVRKTRVSLTESALVTYEKQTLGITHPLLQGGAQRAYRHNYVYPNGSEIIIGGLDNPTRIMSTEFDGIYFQEAIEGTEEDCEMLLTRLRNGRTPYHQLLMDTNPSFPLHWLNQRSLDGKTRMIFCRHEDNPRLYRDGQWTPEGVLYLKTLDGLTGIRKERLRWGKWVQAEGVIYDNFSVEHNVTTDAEYDPNLPVIWGVDDGYAYGQGIGTTGYHPRVIVMGNLTPQGGINVFYTYLKTLELADTTLANVLALPYKQPDIALIDSAAPELKGRIHAMGISAMGATHPVVEGIKNIRRMVCDGQGVRLLKIHPRCTDMIREFQSYRYADHGRVSAGEISPLKMDDHTMDALRYMAWHLRFQVPFA